MLSLGRDAWFPHLTDRNHRVTSPATDEYNCAAWAIGETERPWWPVEPERTDRTHYWPSGARLDNSLEAFEEGFRLLGWEVCPSSGLEADYDKIAIYADAKGKPKHVARQLPDGRWTSKLGDLQDIEHDTLADVESPDYGSARMFMKKRRDG